MKDFMLELPFGFIFGKAIIQSEIITKPSGLNNRAT
jgi:hypothetical protein